jgi:hypothetical protein
MPRILKALAYLAALMLWSSVVPQPLTGQFVTPLPKPLPAESSFARSVRLEFVEAASNAAKEPDKFQLDSSLITRASGDTTPVTLADSLAAYCKGTLHVSDSAAVAHCGTALILPPDSTRPVSANKVAKVKRHIFTKPFRYQEDVLPLYDTAGVGDFDLLRRVASNISEKELYVTTDVVSGLIGGLIFGVSYAAIVSNKESLATRTDTLSANAREDGFANVARLINNGGTFSARIQAPLYAGGGTVMQHSGSIYLQLGALGPMGNRDSLHFSGAAVAEWLTGFAIRDHDLVHRDAKAELVVGVRGGLGWSSGSPIVRSNRCGEGKCETLPFAQLGIGLRQGGTIGFSFLFTVVPNEFKDFKPEVAVNLSAIRQ